jgi:hypothetical protein
VRELTLRDGPPYRVYETPADLAVLAEAAARAPQVWLDTELADWNTPNPRLSLVQLRLPDGSLHVLDVLSPEMAAAYRETFVPAVIAAPQVEKWAHYARFERRVLGPEIVQGLRCTFELARGVPYHRLPLRSLRLSVLVHHFFGLAIDKTFQRADWGRRPLSREELDYAAWDPEWCFRIHERLRPLVRYWDAAAEDPVAIHRAYVDVLPDLRDAKHRREAMWAAIKTYMVSGGHERFADFLLQTRVVRTVPVHALAAAVREVDPIGGVEFAVPVPRDVLDGLRYRGEAAVRAAGRETVTSRFRGPTAPRVPRPVYELDPGDPDALGQEFALVDHRHRTLESERQELRERMRAWMGHTGQTTWGQFEVADNPPRLSVDVRVVADWLLDGEAPSTGLPARFLAAFSQPQLAALSEYVDATANPVMRWRPDRATVVPVDMAQSRDWHWEPEE